MATKEQIVARRQVAVERYIRSTLPVFYLPLWKRDSQGSSQFLSDDGYGYLVTKTGTTKQIDGYDFNGVADRMNVGTPANLLSPTSGTRLIWLKGSGYMGASDIDAPAYYVYLNAQSANNRFQFVASPGVASYTLTSSNGSFVTTAWNCVAIASNGSETFIDINGVAQILTVTGTNNGDWYGDMANLDTYTIGATRYSGGVDYFDGVVGEYLEYNKFLPFPIRAKFYQLTKWRYR